MRFVFAVCIGMALGYAAALTTPHERGPSTLIQNSCPGAPVINPNEELVKALGHFHALSSACAHHLDRCVQMSQELLSRVEYCGTQLVREQEDVSYWKNKYLATD